MMMPVRCLLELGESLLRGTEVARLQRLGERIYQIVRIGRTGGRCRCGGRLGREVFLKCGEGLLRGFEIAGLQRLGEGLEIGFDLLRLDLPIDG